MCGVAFHIRENLERVRRNIRAAALRSNRSPDSVRVVAVTKAVGIEEIRTLYALGIREFGENRLADAEKKIVALGSGDITWHMVGTLQTRKVRDAVKYFHRIDSVDRISIAEEIEKQAARQQKLVRVLLEVNVSGEASKHGFSPQQLPEIIERTKAMPHILVEGLMTMAPFVSDPEQTRPCFAALRELAAQFGVAELSMGMSNDYEVAVEEGATEVRIGTALFEGVNKGF